MEWDEFKNFSLSKDLLVFRIRDSMLVNYIRCGILSQKDPTILPTKLFVLTLMEYNTQVQLRLKTQKHNSIKQSFLLVLQLNKNGLLILLRKSKVNSLLRQQLLKTFLQALILMVQVDFLQWNSEMASGNFHLDWPLEKLTNWWFDLIQIKMEWLTIKNSWTNLPQESRKKLT